ncbi:VWA domain-containing protein [Flammeovirga aprica]|uniref:VWA domain-containing protein n=1 Tax=Flammeovirga aprica JL-4 TaxID=694437 RepID=A0A7X9P0Q3_9BACT|nr:VWA domain-containing protein [Flammeovirga aprica]NME67300.1 VWA domain-containing protein [Flammeovirga aprica JL-4]
MKEIEAFFEGFSTNIHFIRPDYLWALVPVGILFILSWISIRESEGWKKLINPQLLNLLLIKGNKRGAWFPKMLMIFTASILVIAMAGPTWKRVDKPGNQTEAKVVIVLDMSRSMLATDIGPSRLERAKMKIKDYLKINQGVQTGLVVFAGSAHEALPPTKDYKTFRSTLDALSPSSMPLQGSNLPDALDLTDKILENTDAPSFVWIITDDINASDVQAFGQRSNTKDQYNLLVLATPQGAHIPTYRNRILKDKNGKAVTVGLNTAQLQNAIAMPHVNLTPFTLDNTDVELYAKNIQDNLVFTKDSTKAEEDWVDAGYYLSFVVAFFLLFWFRKGLLVQWTWILLLPMFFISCDSIDQLPKDDLKAKDLFYTRDQQAQELLDKGDTATAAVTFSDQSQAGYAYSKMGDYEKAADAYAEDITANNMYNLGVSQAKLGNWEAAQKAFQMALDIDPQFKEAEKNFNIASEQVRMININMSEGSKLNEKDPFKGKKYEPEAGEQEQESAQHSDRKGEGEGETIQEMGEKEVNPTMEELLQMQFSETKQQSKASMIRQVKLDPSMYLKKKFQYQYLTDEDKPKKSDQSW